MYREPADGRSRTHWAFNEYGNVRSLGRNKRAIVLFVVVALAAIALVVLERLA